MVNRLANTEEVDFFGESSFRFLLIVDSLRDLYFVDAQESLGRHPKNSFVKLLARVGNF